MSSQDEIDKLLQDNQQLAQELEKMRSVDIGKNKDIERLYADIEGYKERIKELEEIERVRVKENDFRSAADLSVSNLVLWTHPELAKPMFLQLRKAIDAHDKYIKENRVSSKRIVFEPDDNDKNKIVRIYFEGSEDV